MVKSSSFEMLIPKLSRLFPIQNAVYVGELETALHTCLSKHSDRLILTGEAAESHSEDTVENLDLHPVLFSDQAGTKTYYHASLESMSGLIDPASLKKYWKNISVKSEEDRDVTTLDRYIARAGGEAFNLEKINWLILDVLSAGNVLQGAKQTLKNVDCVVAKTIFDNSADNELEKNTFTAISNALADAGFVFYEEMKNTNPSFGYGIFVKDWKQAAHVIESRKTRLEAVHQEATEALKKQSEALDNLEVELKAQEAACAEAKASLSALDDAHRALEAERDALEERRSVAVTSLTELDEAHSALKAENQALEKSYKAANVTIGELKAAVEKLKDNESTLDALAPEFNQIKDELANLRAGYSPQDEIDTLSDNLRETTKSLKLTTQMHLKKEIDYRDLEEKYAKLVQSSKSTSSKKKRVSKSGDPIRIIHHLSCTGGTLFAKCLAAQPNVLLLNEVDPLSTILVNTKKAEFTPTDLIGLLRQADTNVDPKILSDVFLSGLVPLKDNLETRGITLIGRNHSHGKYLTGDKITDRESFKDIVASEYDVISLVTVRHPIDSFLSLQNNGWDQHFSPSTFDEYCKRYLTFLDDMAGIDIVRYEDFVDDPQTIMGQMCDILKISYDENFADIFDAYAFSGASGRTTGEIGKRDRREVSDEIAKEVAASKAYEKLRIRLNY